MLSIVGLGSRGRLQLGAVAWTAAARAFAWLANVFADRATMDNLATRLKMRKKVQLQTFCGSALQVSISGASMTAAETDSAM